MVAVAMLDGESQIETVLNNRKAWLGLVKARRKELQQFLGWAAHCEAGAPRTSLRFEHRPDIQRCDRVLNRFCERWWDVAVYSCFDSETGSTAAATQFAAPPPSRAKAVRAIRQIQFPPRSVQNHRAQATLARAKAALVSISEHADEVAGVLCDPGATFDERLHQLQRMDIDGWGRTTYFDSLARAGVLKVGAATYRPLKAYLAGSTGPKSGFRKVWNIEPGGGNAEACEELLRMWTRDWDVVANEAKIEWVERPYDSADFENALCVFQESPHKGLPSPAAFV